MPARSALPILSLAALVAGGSSAGAQEYRSYSNFPAPEKWVDAGVSETGVSYKVQTGSIREQKDEKEGFTYRSARLSASFPADHGTGIRMTTYHQVYRCDTRQLAMTYSLTSYRDNRPIETHHYKRDEWTWEEFGWLPDHEKAAFDLVCHERM